MMKNATIEKIQDIIVHPNADKLEIAKIRGYSCIIPKEKYAVGDIVIYIKPDSVLPELEWAKEYKQYAPTRVKSIKLRNEWSEGIIVPLDVLNGPVSNNYGTGSITEPTTLPILFSFMKTGLYGQVDSSTYLSIGSSVDDILDIKHYEPILPQELNAVGVLPYGIGKTDEERFESIDSLPYGEKVDVTLKIDGQSCSYYYKLDEDKFGVLGRKLEYPEDGNSLYAINAKKLNIKEKLITFCKKYGVSLCIRGEQYGNNIQKNQYNPHSSVPLNWAMFSVYLLDSRRYANKGDRFYYLDIAKELGLPTVPTLEVDIELTPILINHYAENIIKIGGDCFEGVVIKHRNGSFKVINKYYDSKK